jgi:hypothetical protein
LLAIIANVKLIRIIGNQEFFFNAEFQELRSVLYKPTLVLFEVNLESLLVMNNGHFIARQIINLDVAHIADLLMHKLFESFIKLLVLGSQPENYLFRDEKHERRLN